MAGVFRKSRYSRLYIDGALRIESTSFTGDTGSGSSPLYFGRRGDGKYFKGMIDDVRIYSRALGEAELLTLSRAER